MQDVEKTTYAINRLIASSSISPSLVKRIKDLDVDNDGLLSAEEVLVAFKKEQEANEDRQTLRWITIATIIGLLLTIGALGGAIYGMVKLNQDINVANDSILTSSSSGGMLSTGVAKSKSSLSTLYESGSIIPALTLEKVILDLDADRSVVLTVSTILVNPNVSATINTTIGQVLIVDANGVRALNNMTGTIGRRLLWFWDDVADWVSGAAESTANWVSGAAETVSSGVTSGYSTVSDYFSNTFGSSTFSSIFSSVNNIFNTISATVTQGWDYLSNYVVGYVSDIGSCVSDPIGNYQKCIKFIPCSGVGQDIYAKCAADPGCVQSASGFGSNLFESVKSDITGCTSGDLEKCRQVAACIKTGLQLTK